MPSYRCSDCGINYPAGYDYNKCPVHGTPTQWFGSDPTEDWQDAMAALQEQLEPAKAESLEDLIPLVENAKVRVVPGGAYFVHAWDVYASLKRRLESTELFRVGKQTFEVLEYLEESREYWVRPFATEVTDDDLAGLLAG